MTDIPLILASNSPRRRELLALTGLPFTIRPANLEEAVLPGEDPRAYAARTAREKALALAAQLAAEPGQLILAADTVVALDGQILGKPAASEEARTMLSALSGKRHTVYTALAACHTGTGRLEEVMCASEVRMRALSADEMDAYIDSGDPFDKAGGYAIQNPHFRLVDSFHGCYTNIIGLPLCSVSELLGRFGLATSLELTPSDDPSRAHPCPTCAQLLAHSAA